MMGKSKRSFSYHWGTGVVAEEAQVQGEHHVPTIQLLQFDDGAAAEAVSIRFCHHSHRGRFSRSPLLMSTDEVDMMREALKETPELRQLLLKLVVED